MKTIHKFDMVAAIPQKVSLPGDARIIHVGWQPERQDAFQFSIWVELDDADLKAPRMMVAIGTGMEVPDGYRYVGTAVTDPYVWHLYEEVGP